MGEVFVGLGLEHHHLKLWSWSLLLWSSRIITKVNCLSHYDCWVRIRYHYL